MVVDCGPQRSAGQSPSHGGHLKCAPSPELMPTGTEGGAPSKLRCLSTQPCTQFPRESGGCLRQPCGVPEGHFYHARDCSPGTYQGQLRAEPSRRHRLHFFVFVSVLKVLISAGTALRSSLLG